MIKSHEDKENKSQEKKDKLTDQRSEHDKNIEKFKNKIQNAEVELDKEKKRLDDKFKSLKSHIEVWSTYF